MNTLIIEKLIERYSLSQLVQAERDIAYANKTEIKVEGNDPGEQFAYLYASIQVLEGMQKYGLDFQAALRQFATTVRTSFT